MRMNFQEYSPKWDAKFSTGTPSKVLVSWLYQCLSFTLKLSIATSKCGLFSDSFPKLIQSSMKMTKSHLEFDLEVYKKQ